MQLPLKHLKLFRRLNDKYGTNSQFFAVLHKQLIKYYAYLVWPRYLIGKHQLFARNGKSSIYYYSFKRTGHKPHQFKELKKKFRSSRILAYEATKILLKSDAAKLIKKRSRQKQKKRCSSQPALHISNEIIEINDDDDDFDVSFVAESNLVSKTLTTISNNAIGTVNTTVDRTKEIIKDTSQNTETIADQYSTGKVVKVNDENIESGNSIIEQASAEQLVTVNQPNIESVPHPLVDNSIKVYDEAIESDKAIIGQLSTEKSVNLLDEELENNKSIMEKPLTKKLARKSNRKPNKNFINNFIKTNNKLPNENIVKSDDEHEIIDNMTRAKVMRRSARLSVIPLKKEIPSKGKRKKKINEILKKTKKIEGKIAVMPPKTTSQKIKENIVADLEIKKGFNNKNSMELTEKSNESNTATVEANSQLITKPLIKVKSKRGRKRKIQNIEIDPKENNESINKTAEVIATNETPTPMVENVMVSGNDVISAEVINTQNKENACHNEDFSAEIVSDTALNEENDNNKGVTSANIVSDSSPKEPAFADSYAELIEHVQPDQSTMLENDADKIIVLNNNDTGKNDVTITDNDESVAISPDEIANSDPTSSEESCSSEDDDDEEDDDEHEGEVGENSTHVPEPIQSVASQKPDDALLRPEEVTKQLREQLNLLQMGKRNVSLLGEKNTSRTSQTNINTPTVSGNTTPSRDQGRSRRNTECEAGPGTASNDASQWAIDISSPISIDGQKTPNGTDINSKPNFIDSLISKIKQTSTTTSPEANITIKSIYSNASSSAAQSSPTKTTNNTSIASLRRKCKRMSGGYYSNDDNASNHSASSTNDFLGFQEVEATRPSGPTLLATPVVLQSSVQSAFISEELDTFMKENSLGNAETVATVPKRRAHDEAMMSAEARPPTLTCPERPQHMEKPRTVAEKRILLEKETDIRYLMIENESTVYRELIKRSRAGGVSANINLIRGVQNHDIPFTRDTWRASCWLCTENGKFYFQTIRSEGEHIKLISGRGNNERKCIYEIPKLSKIAERKKFNCGSKCNSFDGIRINNLEAILPPVAPSSIAHIRPKTEIKMEVQQSPISKLNTLRNNSIYAKPAPLSQKYLSKKRSSLDADLGPLEVYQMPTVQLSVMPKHGQELPETVKSYLKIAMPYECMTEEWVNFSLSTLKYTVVKRKTKRKRVTQKEVKVQKERVYTFDIPYCNDQTKILIRRRRHIMSSTRYSTAEPIINEEPLTFDKNVDKNDTVAVDVANVLNSMFNSVALSINEASLTKVDPDMKVYDAVANEPSVSMPDNTVSPAKKIKASNRVLYELRRLNATIIDARVEPVKENCTEEFCKLGCICDSLAIPERFSYHCGKLQCMLEKQCKNKSHPKNFTNHGNSNIQQLRDRATARLAKVERDFTATLVMAGDDKTIYIPNSETIGKRNKKVPKRFDEYDFAVNNSDRAESDVTVITQEITKVATPQRAPSLESALKPQIKATYELTAGRIGGSVQVNDVLHRLQHVNVSVVNLPYLEMFEPWCMVHCLYKCFCKGEATEGQPFKFSDNTIAVTGNAKVPPEVICKNVSNTVISTTVSTASKKRKYTFDNRIDNVYNDDLIEPLRKVPRSSMELPVEREIFSSARIRCIHTMSLIIRNRNKAPAIREEVRALEALSPKFHVLMDRHIRSCLLYTEPVIGSSSESPNHSTLQIHNKSIEEKARANRASLLKPKPFATDVSPSNSTSTDARSPERSITSPPTASTPRKPTADWNTPLINTQPVNNFARDKHNLHYMNYWVNRVMHQITEYQKSFKPIKKPVSKALNCVQWCHMIELFNQDQIYVWEVQMDNKEIILALTVENVMPFVTRAICVINIKVVVPDRLPMLAKLLRQGITNDQTKQLAVLMCGASNYWKIIGFMHSRNNYMEMGVDVRPTPSTHPLLSEKINRLYKIFTQKHGDNGTLPNINEDAGQASNTAESLASRLASTSATAECQMETTQSEAAQAKNVQLENEKAKTTSALKSKPIQPEKPTNPHKIISNIPIKDLLENDLRSIFVPLPVVGAHRWFMLTLGLDFSHIYIPTWKNFLSFAKITNALKFAKRSNRTVKISTQNVGPEVYAVHNEDSKIFFGPYRMDEDMNLALYQIMDGRMLLMEEFEKLMKPKRSSRTSGCWLYMKDDKVLINVPEKPCAPESTSTPPEIEKEATSESDTDDDCVIIEQDNSMPMIEIHDDSPATDDQVQLSNTTRITPNFTVQRMPELVNISNALPPVVTTSNSMPPLLITLPSSTSFVNSISCASATTTRPNISLSPPAIVLNALTRPLLLASCSSTMSSITSTTNSGGSGYISGGKLIPGRRPTITFTTNRLTGSHLQTNSINPMITTKVNPSNISAPVPAMIRARRPTISVATNLTADEPCAITLPMEVISKASANNNPSKPSVNQFNPAAITLPLPTSGGIVRLPVSSGIIRPKIRLPLNFLPNATRPIAITIPNVNTIPSNNTFPTSSGIPTSIAIPRPIVTTTATVFRAAANSVPITSILTTKTTTSTSVTKDTPIYHQKPILMSNVTKQRVESDARRSLPLQNSKTKMPQATTTGIHSRSIISGVQKKLVKSDASQLTLKTNTPKNKTYKPLPVLPSNAIKPAPRLPRISPPKRIMTRKTSIDVLLPVTDSTSSLNTQRPSISIIPLLQDSPERNHPSTGSMDSSSSAYAVASPRAKIGMKRRNTMAGLSKAADGLAPPKIPKCLSVTSYPAATAALSEKTGQFYSIVTEPLQKAHKGEDLTNLIGSGTTMKLVRIQTPGSASASNRTVSSKLPLDNISVTYGMSTTTLQASQRNPNQGRLANPSSSKLQLNVPQVKSQSYIPLVDTPQTSMASVRPLNRILLPKLSKPKQPKLPQRNIARSPHPSKTPITTCQSMHQNAIPSKTQYAKMLTSTKSTTSDVQSSNLIITKITSGSAATFGMSNTSAQSTSQSSISKPKLSSPSKTIPSEINNDNQPRVITATSVQKLPPITNVTGGIPNRKEVIEVLSDEEQSTSRSHLSNVSISAMAAVTAQNVMESHGLSNQVVCVVKGALISNIVGLGRIEAFHRADGIKMKLNTMKGTLKVDGIEHANTYLDTYMRQLVYAFEPQTLKVVWKFVPESKVDPAYVMQTPEMFTPSMVVTQNGLIDLKSDFESDSSLTKGLIENLLILKLADLCMEKPDIVNKTVDEILHQGEEYIRALMKDEAKAEKIKMFYGIKIHLNKIKVKKLRQKIRWMQAPVAVISASNDGAVASTSRGESESLQPAPVITIDDDDVDDEFD